MDDAPADILLVDDEQGFVETLAERLRLRGYAVATAGDADSALVRLCQGDVGVVVLDVQMPGKDGLQALAEMKAQDASVQVVLLTGHATLESAVEGMKRGALDYLTKPADIDRLVEILGRAQRRRLQAQESLRMQELAKLAVVGQLAEGVAHELNTPLMVINQAAGWLQDLLGEPPENLPGHLPELRSTLADIARHGRRCGEITRKLLRFAGRVDHTRRLLRLDEVIREVAAAEEPEATSAGVRIRLDLAADVPLLLSRMEMEELLRNLLRNALDAMAGRAGEVSVSSRIADGWLKVEVRDQGSGIAHEYRRRIFEPFFSTKEVGKGTGLGLAICYGIVQGLGGEIGFESPPAPGGQGTVFHFRLPLAILTTPPATTCSSSDLPGAG